jgi:glycosyltransferase involved in cell wall biosynthesis
VSRRIAIWIHGGVGGGFFSQGQPAIQQIIDRLSVRYEISIYSMLPPNSDFEPQGYRLHTVNRKIKGNLIRWTLLILKYLFHNFQEPHSILYSFWGYPAGVIVTCLGKILQKPTIIHLQGGDSVSISALRYGVFYNPVRAALSRWAYTRCSLLIALTHYQVSFLRQHKIQRPIEVIPFGVDLKQFSFQEDRFKDPTLKFLHVGNQTPVKDQETMLRAFSLVASKIPSHLTIIGGDFYSDQLNRWCVQYGITDVVLFLGAVTHSSLPAFYHQADILLHTSVYEGEGLVFAEAAACGTLIAGTRVGLLADMGEECGIIVPPGDADLLATKIMTILRYPDHIDTMRQCAKTWIEKRNIHYTEREITERLESLSKEH